MTIKRNIFISEYISLLLCLYYITLSIEALKMLVSKNLNLNLTWHVINAFFRLFCRRVEGPVFFRWTLYFSLCFSCFFTTLSCIFTLCSLLLLFLFTFCLIKIIKKIKTIKIIIDYLYFAL